MIEVASFVVGFLAGAVFLFVLTRLPQKPTSQAWFTGAHCPECRARSTSNSWFCCPDCGNGHIRNFEPMRWLNGRLQTRAEAEAAKSTEEPDATK